MILNIVALVLVLAITFMHSVFGVFSGIINLACTIVAAATAFAFFEPLSLWLIQQAPLHPAYVPPTVLVLLFVLTLGGLRAAADGLIRGNVRVPPALDWGGAGVCGFLNAQLTVGMLVICVQMLPLGGTTMGFTRYERSDDNDELHAELASFRRNSLWLRQDEFTLGLVSALSGGSLRASTPLAEVYPRFSDWLFYTGNTVQWESSPVIFRDEKGDGLKGGLKVEKWWEQTEPIEGRYRQQVPTEEKPYPDYKAMSFAPASGYKLVVVRVALTPSSADRDESRRVHLFRPTMLRLVGADEGGRVRDYTARIVAGADEKIDGRPRIADLDTNFSLDGAADQTVEAVFEVDADVTPRFFEYRRFARAALAPDKLVKAKVEGKRPDVPALTLVSAEARAAGAGTGSARGALRFVDTIEHPSGDVIRLPFKMTVARLRAAGVELEGNRFKSGRVFGDRSRFEPAPADEEPASEEFLLPAGYRLCQIRYKPKKALTLAGQVFNYVARTVNTYRATDNAGDTYPLCGYYAIVKRGGREYFELFYTAEPEPMTFRSMLDFNEIKPSELTDDDDAVLGLFFLVRAGRVVTGVQNQTGQGVSGLEYTMLSAGP